MLHGKSYFNSNKLKRVHIQIKKKQDETERKKNRDHSLTYVFLAGGFNTREDNPKFTANSLMEGGKLTNKIKTNKVTKLATKNKLKNEKGVNNKNHTQYKKLKCVSNIN
jgi:hypothetical protein